MCADWLRARFHADGAGSEMHKSLIALVRVALAESWREVPSEAMMRAIIESMDAWCEPFDPEYEDGHKMSDGMSQRDADELNAESRKDALKIFKAMAAVRLAEIEGK